MGDSICALMQQGKWIEAQSAADTWVGNNPSNPKAQAMLGICHYHFSNFADACDCFARATALDPDFADAGIKHARCLDRLQRYEEAYEVAKHWMEKRPSDEALKIFVRGLSSHVEEKITDSWQLTAKPRIHNVTLAQE